MHKVTVVGIGDDGPNGLSDEAGAAVAVASLLIGGRRHLAWFTGHSAETLEIGGNLPDVAARALGACQRDNVVVLASGDPLFFGIGTYLSERLGADRVRVLPHVSSVQLAFARAGASWHDAIVLSTHGRPLAAIIRPALDAAKVAVMTDDVHTPAVIGDALRAAGMEDCPVMVCEHLGGPRERVVRSTLFSLRDKEFAALNVLLLLRDDPRRPAMALGMADDAFEHPRNQITKSEVRAVTLAKLRLRRGDTVWDIGAGSGSVAIEAALLCHGPVFAVERNGSHLELLRQNVRRFYAANVVVVEGAAPEALAALPPPDAVFVGGSGGRMEAILNAAAGALRREGTIVLNLATLDNLATCRRWFKERQGWVTDTTQISVARSRVIGDDERLAALNPVWIVSAKRDMGDAQSERTS